MFQKLDDASAAFEILSREEEEARGGVTERREVVENNPAYLYCDTNAIPPPELTWYREDQPLSAADGVSVLQGSLGCAGRSGIGGQRSGFTRLGAGLLYCPYESWSSPVSCLLCGCVTTGRPRDHPGPRLPFANLG